MFSSGCVNFIHPLRYSGGYATLWFILHMPAVAALTLCGDAGAVLIALETGVPQGIRWFFCAGLSVGLVSTGLLAVLERERDDGILVMRKVGCIRSSCKTILLKLTFLNRSAFD